jgi:hypothetical protein
MIHSMIARRNKITMLVVAAFFFATSAGPALAAKSAVKMKSFEGTIDFNEAGPSAFTLDGTASHLGRFTADGEVEFVPGREPGSLVGQGSVVFEAANGDLLVGNVSWDVPPGGDLRTSAIRFVWADSVEFSDGTVVFNTGRFVTDRPPGLVVIAIIAVLIGLLLPAIQK